MTDEPVDLTTTRNVAISVEAHTRLRERAKAEGRTMGWMATQAIEEYLARTEAAQAAEK